LRDFEALNQAGNRTFCLGDFADAAGTQYPVREHTAFYPYKETYMPVRGLKTAQIHVLK